MKMKNNFFLIKEVNEERMVNGIWLPPSARDSRRAIVLEVPKGDEDIKVGDEIIKTIGNGTEVRKDGEWVEAINKVHILGVVKNKLGGEENK